MFKIIKILTKQKNYIWILKNKKNYCIIVDPSESKLTTNIIKKKKLVPKIILITHYHTDHIQGIPYLLKKYAIKKIYGPKDIKKKYNFSVIPVYHLQQLILLKKKFRIFYTPGHSKIDISFYIKPFLFCGDILFSGGCGRVFKKNYKKMFNSINVIKLFPNNTILCCGHEYILPNLIFSYKIIKKDKNIKKYLKKIKNLLDKNIPLSTIKNEKKINIFLRTNEKKIKKIFFKNYKEKTSYDCFRKIRNKKDKI